MQTLTGGDRLYHLIIRSAAATPVVDIAKFKNCPVDLALSQWLDTLKLKQYTFRRLAQ
jgi:hypothetical protein